MKNGAIKVVKILEKIDFRIIVSIVLKVEITEFVRLSVFDFEFYIIDERSNTHETSKNLN